MSSRLLLQGPRAGALAAPALLLALAAACASPSLREPAAAITVRNASGVRVAEIVGRACDGGDAAWQDVGVGALDPGASTRIPMPQSCVDLEARDPDGHVRARQSGLTLRPGTPAVWTIR